MIASLLSGHCDIISNQLCRLQQNVNRTSETRGWCMNIAVLSSFMDSWRRASNKIMYVLSLRTKCVCANSNDILVFICLATPEINIKITLYWAIKIANLIVWQICEMDLHFRRKALHLVYKGFEVCWIPKYWGEGVGKLGNQRDPFIWGFSMTWIFSHYIFKFWGLPCMHFHIHGYISINLESHRRFNYFYQNCWIVIHITMNCYHKRSKWY